MQVNYERFVGVELANKVFCNSYGKGHFLVYIISENNIILTKSFRTWSKSGFCSKR